MKVDVKLKLIVGHYLREKTFCYGKQEEMIKVTRQPSRKTQDKRHNFFPSFFSPEKIRFEKVRGFPKL